MDKDYSLYENMDIPDIHFPIRLFNINTEQAGEAFSMHWHEQIEFLYFKKGSALIHCNAMPIQADAKDLIVINSNDLHQGENLGGTLEYYCIIIDLSMLHSYWNDTVETKYITPITQNRLLFNNKISGDQQIIDCIDRIVFEYEHKEIGFELSIKSAIFNLIVLMLRNYVQSVISHNEYEVRHRNRERFNGILKYIEQHHAEKIPVESLASMANLSTYHFSRLFDEVTGRTPGEYINYVRIHKAEQLLRNTDLNITEIALSTGFNDINYFSRMFKKIKSITPTSYRKLRDS